VDGSAVQLHLGCSTDNAYLPHTAAMLHSMLSQAGGMQVCAHLLHGPALDLPDAQRVVEMVEAAGGRLLLHEIPDERIAGLPAMEYAGISTTMWYRIFLPELLGELDRILYVDVDTIAVDDLTPLWQTDLADNYLAAVTNVWEPWNAGYPTRWGMPLEGPATYFNSGVILMNLAELRRGDCARRLQEWAREHSSELVWPDQDALNALLGTRRVALHPRWNCMNSILTFPQAVEVFGEEVVAEARRNPGIRHFEGPGPNKPWHVLSDPDTAEAYMRHRAHTPWPRVKRTGVTPANLLRRALRRRRAR
jgi:lipopolysaccharide biosynthesis glycosyltransferase